MTSNNETKQCPLDHLMQTMATVMTSELFLLGLSDKMSSPTWFELVTKHKPGKKTWLLVFKLQPKDPHQNHASAPPVLASF